MNPFKLLSLIVYFFRIGVAVNTANIPSMMANIPPGMVPDNQSMFGLMALLNNIDAIDWDLVAVPTAATQTPTLLASQLFCNVCDYTSTAGGAITLTLPTVAQIVAALPNTTPANGFSWLWLFMNDGAGQTVTVTGVTNVTVLGTATVATNTTRAFLVNVNINTGKVTLLNLGTMNL